MSQQVTINGRHLMHFHDVSTLCLDPISFQMRHKSVKSCELANLLIEVNTEFNQTEKVNHECLSQSLTKNNGIFLGNFRYLGKIILLMSSGSIANINSYRAITTQLISIHEDIVSKVIMLHKRECNQISLNPDHSSLKYLNLPSKKIIFLKQRKNNVCRVCSRGVELIRVHLLLKYMCLATIDELSQIVSLSSISQQWVLNRKKIILESINLGNTISVDYEYKLTACHETYDELLHDMDIIGQLKRVGCPFHVSKNFSPLRMIINASNFYNMPKVNKVSSSLIQHLLLYFVKNGEYMKIYQTCWMIFNNVMFNNNNYNHDYNYENKIELATTMKYAVDFYLICLAALDKTQVNLFDINFDSEYTNLTGDESSCKFKRRIGIFNSIYACHQLHVKYQYIYTQATNNRRYHGNLDEKQKQNNETKILEVKRIRTLIALWLIEKQSTNDMKRKGELGLKFETRKNENDDDTEFEKPIDQWETLWRLQTAISEYINTGNIEHVTQTVTLNLQVCSQYQQLKTKLGDLKFIHRALCVAIIAYLASLPNCNFHDSCSNNINTNDKNVDIVNCNQLFQDLFDDVATYLRYSQMIGVSQHTIVSVNCDNISNIFLCYALYLWQMKSHKAKKYFKYCLKLTPLNGIMYYYYSLYLFQIEKNYKQSFYNLKVSKKLGSNLDKIVQQFKLLYKKFEWKKNSFGFICDYNQCGNENTLTSKKLICANCKCAWYCNKKCQKKDWTVKHKNECIGKYLSLLNLKEQQLIRQQIWLIQHN